MLVNKTVFSRHQNEKYRTLQLQMDYRLEQSGRCSLQDQFFLLR